MDRIGLLRRYGLVARTVCCRDRPARLRGRDPREAWVASCRTVAGSLRCPCGIGEPCGRPVGAAFGQARPRGRRGIGLGPVGVALAGGSLRVARCADIAAPEAAVAPGTLRVTWHLPRLHAPEPRTGAPVQASVRRFSGVARTVVPTSPLRSELAGKWSELWATAGNARKCVRGRLESARARYVGRCGAPRHSGGARHAV